MDNHNLPFLGNHLIFHHSHKHDIGTKPHKTNIGSKTIAERITWMSRTSDVHGSFHNTTAEANTTLIRRKIQERCGNTQELMAAIRRLKTGETGHVTPTEFRLTMIKFGISIPQSLCDSIFILFDSDRSGTIDFDEFAMWIMNSEFRPVKKNEKNNNEGLEGIETPLNSLKTRLKQSLDQYPEVFNTMKKRISFLDLSADIIRKNMPMTEKDARYLFKILDPSNIGLIDSIMLKRYGYEGLTEPPPQSASSILPFQSLSATSLRPDLQESVYKICGKNTNILLECFINYDENSQLKYDEFRRVLLSQNLGVNQRDTQNLFLALDGQKGLCDLSILLRNIKPFPLDPASEVSSKSKKPTYIHQSRADRRLREAIRKVYKQLHHTLASCDRDGSGFINPELFCRVLNGLVMPINYEDFRFMMRSVHTNNSGNYSYSHFLTLYDPNLAPHELSGVATVTAQAENVYNQALQQSQSLPYFGSSHSVSQSMSFEDRPGNTSVNPAADRATNELKRMWQNALRSCKAQDESKTGFINKNIFMSAIEQHLGSSMSSDAIESLANTYAAGDDVDYHTCFRASLNEIMNGPISTNKSVFQIAPLTKARDVGASHPWDFNYQQGIPMKSNNDDLTIPYWRRACADPRARPSTTTPSSSSPLDSGGSLTFGFNKTMGASANASSVDLSSYEPKVITACRKVANHPNFRQLKDEFKRSQLVNYKGCISTKNFSAIVTNCQMELTRSESGVISRVFRAKGIPDTMNYQEFVDVCQGAK